MVSSIYSYVRENSCSPLMWISMLILHSKHVFADLQPYLCTFKECGLVMFGDRRTWADHEMGSHRRTHICPLCGKGNFKTRHGLSTHIEQRHGKHSNEVQLEALLNTSSRPIECFTASECPLCNWNEKLQQLNGEEGQMYVTVQQFMKHLAGHLEQAALFALPRNYALEAESNEAGAGAEDSEQTSRSLVGMHSKSWEQDELRSNLRQCDLSELLDQDDHQSQAGEPMEAVSIPQKQSGPPLSIQHLAAQNWVSRASAKNPPCDAETWLMDTAESSGLPSDLHQDSPDDGFDGEDERDSFDTELSMIPTQQRLVPNCNLRQKGQRPQSTHAYSSERTTGEMSNSDV